MEALKECRANLVVYLHPQKAKRVKDAVYRELSSLLFKFNEALDGVVLTYEPKFSSNLAKILPGIHPYFGVRFEAKLLLFYPKPEMLLEGEVVKVGQQSIHIIVLGFASAFIADEDIREDFKYKIKHGKEVYISRSDKKHRIKVGTTLLFSVKSFDEEMLHVCGSLIPTNTGSVQWLERKAEESQADSVTEKSISNKRPVEVLETDNLVPYSEKLKSENHIKKSRRSKNRAS
ncbi:uncharacterized protein LOC107801865 isoform X2 [Nicotiana tabacum]|uniref:DNA-directed RNA polymerase subunit n=1 Tax=Nicotiana tabacum TaxID=4097 RepID=A0A1S4AVX4_TOBAC|nr:PREDICTED: uncharacterized protein LOC107801865 isoform X1 [Nicotiana tabacum]XP_016480751.1 PREDICTED: uncharacterized protein LOC107801865 isoform X1 [Nicotiana tabacum]XP_016480753.1 PREDICTED: uncharacterized protein LOC107801865 isoform X1 [Nicotiana tabacum]